VKRCTDARGFTLVEVLVAIAILAIVAVLAYRATSAMTDSEARLAVETDRWRTLDAIFARLEADLRQAIPRGVRAAGLREPAWFIAPADTLGNSALIFTRAGPEFTEEPGIAGQRIGYRLSNGLLELSYWPHLDNAAGVTPTVYALARDVTRFRVWALTATNTLTDHWPLISDPGVPRGVKVEVTLADGTQIERWFALR
jgi:general secretion pathway protein J